MSDTEVGSTYCACPTGSGCAGVRAVPPLSSVTAGAGAAGAWLAAILTLVTLAAIVLAVLYLIHRRRQ